MATIKKASIFLAVAASLVSAIAIFSGFQKGKSLGIPAPRRERGEGFALVELYTSEGCSSCPAAEELLSAIRKENRARVYLLAFHVDYWDRLGWKDPFSSGDYSRRQSQYAQLFRLNSVYTPQVIINGKKEFVGSDESKLRKTIDNELNTEVKRELEFNLALAKPRDGKAPDTKPSNTKPPDAKSADGNPPYNKIRVQYHATNAGSAKLSLALVQLQANNRVLAGENKGRTLDHINIVRDFKTVGLDKEGTGIVDLKIPSGLTEKDCTVIGFLQNEDDGTVLAVREAVRF